MVRKQGSEPSQPDDPVVQVRLVSANVDEFRKFVESTPLEFACAGPRVNAEGIVTAHVLMARSVATNVAKHGSMKVEITADPSTWTTSQESQIGRGNRFEERHVLPTGRGTLLKEPT